MAGFYPDVPGRRMEWDNDGTVGQYQDGVGLGLEGAGSSYPIANVDLTLQQRQDLNDEDYNIGLTLTATSTGGGGFNILLFFPELRDLDGVYFRTNSVSVGSEWLYDSPDTTNGFDGAWAQSVAVTWSKVDKLDDWRTITSFARTDKRAVKVHQDGDYGGAGAAIISRNLHVYGEFAAGETPDRLLFMDENTALEFALPKDYGDVPRGSARDYTMKLKNNSASLTANTIGGDATDLFGGSASWFTFDVSASGFLGSYSITSLAAGVSSAVITVRQDIPDGAALQLHATRHEVSTVSWT